MPKNTKIFLTIKREMFLLSVLSFLVVSLIISSVFLKLMYDNSLKSARDSLRECNSQIVTFADGLFRENAAIIELLARNQVVIDGEDGNSEELLQIFDNVLDENVNLTYAYAGYEDGSLHIRGYDAPPGYNVTDRPWYQDAVSTEGVAQLVYSDAATGVWLFSQCMRLEDQKGRITGAIALDCSNESISRQLSTKYRYESQRSYIIAPDGTVLIHPSEVFINSSLRSYMDDATWKAVKNGSNYAEYTLSGIRAMAYLERIPDTDLIVVTAINAAEVMNPIIESIVALLVVMITISLLLGLLLSRVFINRFARPIQELSGRIKNLAAGIPDSGRELGTSNAEIHSIAENIEIIVKDIANREEKQKAAEYLSFHDSMTGLYNRRFFEEELNRLDTKRNYPLCLLCCDVNGLKLVNDVFGHALGDRLLIVVANCLQQAMRTDDILARVGGDEFSIILPCTAEIEAQQIVKRLKGAFPVDSLSGAEVSVSLGYAIKYEGDQELEDVLRAADEMMYERKTMESKEMKRHTVENIIIAAEQEGLVRDLSPDEIRLLKFFSDSLCPESEELLLDSYRLRRIGMCTLLFAMGYTQEVLNKRHTEIGYRMLSSLDAYRGVAACVLHYKEHWDGSGWPSGLAGPDIPLLSRIIAVTETFMEQGDEVLVQKSGTWYDEQLVGMLTAEKIAAED